MSERKFNPGKGLLNLGKILAELGLPILGHSVGGPLGAEVARRIGKKIGLGNNAPAEEIAETLANSHPEMLIELRRMEVEKARVENELILGELDADTRRIEAVNETIRTEVLGNPEAGSWRPLWGRWSCYNFWPMVWAIVAIFGYAVVTRQYEIVALIPGIIGAFLGLMGLPGAILGFASYHRGKEKRVLAGETLTTLLSSFGDHDADRNAQGQLIARPIDPDEAHSN